MQQQRNIYQEAKELSDTPAPTSVALQPSWGQQCITSPEPWQGRSAAELWGDMPPCSLTLQHLVGRIADAVAPSAPSPPPWPRGILPRRDDVCRRERQRWDGGSQQVPPASFRASKPEGFCHWRPSHYPQHHQNLLQGAQKTASLQRWASPFPLSPCSVNLQL